MHRLMALILAFFVLTGPVAAATFHFNLFKSGGDGSVVSFSGAGSDSPFFVLAGSDSDQGREIVTSYRALAPEPDGFPFWSDGWTVSGTWTYLTQDWGGPVFDPFGYIVNGVMTQLTSDWGGNNQTGSFSFFINPGDVFGWYVTATDDCCGRAVATVSASIFESKAPAPIPLPAPALLLIGGLAGLGLLRRRAVRA